MAKQRWTVADIPDQSGKTFIVTGANSGLGYETTLALAGKGARVIMACRTESKANQAMDSIRRAHPQADLVFMPLDLSDLASVRAFAEAFAAQAGEQGPRLDVLINNAGVMALPYRKTADGFEMQFGTNHLGHFALTGLLLPALIATPDSRIVNVSSGMHQFGWMNWDDLQWERRYNKWKAYGQSKLANLLFTYALHRRLEKAGLNVKALAAHPGYSSTHLQTAGPELAGSGVRTRLWGAINKVAQTAAMGALPTIYAAVVEGLESGTYYGPDGVAEMRGYPRKVGSNRRSRNVDDQERLWTISEDLTGVKYAFEAAEAA